MRLQQMVDDVGSRTTATTTTDPEVLRYEGDDVELKVTVDIDSVPSEVKLRFLWTKNEREVRLGARYGVHQSAHASRLRIADLSTVDTGHYSCRVVVSNASNGLSNGHTEQRADFHLAVDERQMNDFCDLQDRIRRLHNKNASLDAKTSAPSKRQNGRPIKRLNAVPKPRETSTVASCPTNQNNVSDVTSVEESRDHTVDGNSTTSDAFRFWAVARRRQCSVERNGKTRTATTTPMEPLTKRESLPRQPSSFDNDRSLSPPLLTSETAPVADPFPIPSLRPGEDSKSSSAPPPSAECDPGQVTSPEPVPTPNDVTVNSVTSPETNSPSILAADTEISTACAPDDATAETVASEAAEHDSFAVAVTADDELLATDDVIAAENVTSQESEPKPTIVSNAAADDVITAAAVTLKESEAEPAIAPFPAAAAVTSEESEAEPATVSTPAADDLIADNASVEDSDVAIVVLPFPINEGRAAAAEAMVGGVGTPDDAAADSECQAAARDRKSFDDAAVCALVNKARTDSQEDENMEERSQRAGVQFRHVQEPAEEPPFPDRDVEIRVGVDPWSEFEKLDKIGSGGFSEVFRCREKKSGQVFAAKVARYRASNKANLQYEVDILCQMRHPRVMRLYDVFDHSRRMTLITEYIGGGELCQRIIDDDFLSEEQASNFIVQILRGVNYLHKQSVIHLDLKPENIVCTTKSTYDIKIIDFGFAQRYEGEHKPIRFLGGTANFTAPEVINYEPLTYAADIWAIGVMTFLLLSGYTPFDGESEQEVLVNVTKGNYDYDDPCFETISSAARDFIDQILVKNPSKRPTAQMLLNDDWLRGRGHRSTLHLATSVSHMRCYLSRAREKWKAATTAIMAMQKFRRSQT